MLVVLNRLWRAGLDEDALAALGLRLGADVPVFVRGRNAWAEGVGERLQPIVLEPAWYVVVEPGVHVPHPGSVRRPGFDARQPSGENRGLRFRDPGRERVRTGAAPP